MNQPTPEMVGAALQAWRAPENTGVDVPTMTRAQLRVALAVDPLRTGVTVRVAPGVTLHGDTGAFTATADAPPAEVARLLRQLADDLDRQETR